MLISRIPRQAFKDVSVSYNLYMENNQIETIEVDAFSTLSVVNNL